MLTMYGASDDLVEIEGIVEDEINAISDAVLVTVGDEDGGVLVTWRYGAGQDGCCWAPEISMLGEGKPIPWMISVKHGKSLSDEIGYTAVVSIDCPEGTKVAWAQQNEDGEEIE